MNALPNASGYTAGVGNQAYMIIQIIDIFCELSRNLYTVVLLSVKCAYQSIRSTVL